ncbi:Leucine-rich repeat-containing protein 26 [Eufriesea mexicana]|uniref:uncharacterized protein LOC108549579 n=1 Tax=Eufriesea mexicana TaxID=516756 RepID=UPI00083BBC88|nr:PREDICTED: uncharacterized protein LOC108549579 [Eufriesea mexicana]XP_017758531.1 PREDICTED: uncharacterized protein LOC108549579 [Eufriesea mexicana]XP_017758532.1 PREDICTED: uncharacterized protein LOC108549579 [Eufriesea mexicana]OAD56268.1 Leucine-rich repeat-containing protein 26 [Eufriesea mexicana]
MQRTLLLLFLTLLSYSELTNGLCLLENGTVAHCHELEDVKYIETYDLETLRASEQNPVLHRGFFVNLTTLRHLDLSGGNLERIEPGSFDKLTNLRSLNLAENHIEHLELGSVDGLNHLHSLNLRRNRLQHLPPALARLKVLKHLDIQGNPLQCNCATLRVRDLIVKRGVKIAKKVSCAAPSNVKGTPLFKLDTTLTCHLEEQDREMQNDQAFQNSEEDFGSGDLSDKEGEEEETSGEYVQVTEAVKELESETPFPEVSTSSTAEEAEVPAQTTDSVTKTTSKDEEIFFDSEERKSVTVSQPVKEYKDALFRPVEGSGDDEGSGEGSGTEMIFNWRKTGVVEESEEKEEESTSGTGLLDLVLSVFMTTTKAPVTKVDPELEEEQFIDASSTKGVEEEEIVPKKVDSNEAAPSITEIPTDANSSTPVNGVELVDNELYDMTKLGKVKAEDTSAEKDEASPARQSKRGMGSYIVLAALLAILATLIGFAAYKGDFCRKKRKRSDVENGTELKDMHKALLETANSTQPKIASNGNVENAPFLEDATDEIKVSNDRQVTADIPKSPNGTSDRAEPVKPSRSNTPQNDQRTREPTAHDGNSLKDDSLSARTNSIDPVANSSPIARLPEVNQPPLSPGAQRVKITLQENPDSVPRTPILITRTTAGENLVKSP